MCLATSRPIGCRRIWLAAAASLFLMSMARGGNAAPTLEINLSADNSCIELVGMSQEALDALHAAKLDREQWRHVFAVTVANDDDASALPMLGRYAIHDGMIVFKPRFPLRPGLAYRAVFDPSSLEGTPPPDLAKVAAMLKLPKPAATAATSVVAVYPSGAELPENLLKFYLHFSAPMSRGDVYRHIRIVDAAGQVVPDAFLELPEELWDSDGRRLTLLFDPGRIKRGLKPHEDMGAPLVAGDRYSLIIDAKWRDAHGNPLATGFRKEFRVAAFDEAQPDPHAWRVLIPPVGTNEPLVIHLNEPLDHALLEHSLEVRNTETHVVEGVVTTDEQETRWSFHPAHKWRAGRYELVVDEALEDRAGNSVGRPFEKRIAVGVVGAGSEKPVLVPFTIAAPAP